MPAMTPKVLIRFNVQSFSDIITNSSSEIFCQIQTKDREGIDTIAEHLSMILPITVVPSYEEWDDEEECTSNTIDFWCDMGAFTEYEYIPDVFAALLRQTLNQHFEYGTDYTIETNVDL